MFRPVEMFMHHCHCLFNIEVSCHPTVVGFPDQLRLLTLWNTYMAHTTQKPILKMEIRDNCVCAQHLLGGGVVRVCLIELGPSRGLMTTRVSHRGECRDWRSAEAINDVVDASYFILDVEVELLQVCGPLLMVVILQFSFCFHELQWLMISVDDGLLPKNVMSPLAIGLHDGVHLFVIIRVLMENT
jgi:hypothetical protein